MAGGRRGWDPPGGTHFNSGFPEENRFLFLFWPCVRGLRLHNADLPTMFSILGRDIRI